MCVYVNVYIQTYTHSNAHTHKPAQLKKRIIPFLYLLRCIFVHMCIYACTHANIYTPCKRIITLFYLLRCICTHVYISMNTCIYRHTLHTIYLHTLQTHHSLLIFIAMYLYTRVPMHAHIHISAHPVNPTQPSCTCYMHIYIYIYIYIHACIHMDTQTHTCTPCKPNIAFLYLLRSCESCIVLVIVSCSALHQYQLCQKRPTNMKKETQTHEKRPRKETYFALPSCVAKLHHLGHILLFCVAPNINYVKRDL